MCVSYEHKFEAFDKFKEYQSMVEKQTGKNIKILRSDREGEYLSSEFLNHLKEKDILSEWCSRTEESYSIRYGTVHDMLYRSSYFLLEFCPRDYCICIKHGSV